jgi:hypothetical protein
VEQNVRFTTDFITVYTSTSPLRTIGEPEGSIVPTPPVPAALAQSILAAVTLEALASPSVSAEQSAPQTPIVQPPPATSSGEEEIKVEGELIDKASPSWLLEAAEVGEWGGRQHHLHS